ncbi:3D domain-containing protein [Patescibacteria group bacterium]|nr:3D domain-containing protein [Patescibacteria group bacterium]
MSRYVISATLLLVLGTLSSSFVSDAAPAPETVDVVFANNGALLNESPVATPETSIRPDARRVVTATVTAYSSEVGQTDSTPFITAIGTAVRSGIVAANWLPIGTKIRIPEIFGDRVFVVEDRMHQRHQDRVDIWFSTRAEAVRFGVRKAQIEIL